MKTVVFISSLFFLLGLKLSGIINLPNKSEKVDTIISAKISQVKPLKAVQFFKDNESEKEEKKEAESNASQSSTKEAQ